MALSYNEVKSALDAVTAATGGAFVPFDASYYVSTYIGVTDVANPVGSWSGDMLEHYTLHGAAQNFNPNAWFDAGFYRGRYLDAAGLSGADALVHYAKYGVNEGRAGSAALTNFNAARYLSENPDVVPYVEGNLDDFGGSMSNGALAHYVKFGAGEQRLAYDLGGNLLPFSLTPESSTIAGVAADGVTTVSLNTNAGQTLLVGPSTIDGEDASILRLVGDADIRIDMTNTANQVRGIDLNGDGTIATNGVENNISAAGVATFRNFTILDAYARNPLNTGDRANNFSGDINYSGVGYDGDGVSTDGNIVLGGLGADNILAGIGNDFLAGGGVAVGIAGLPTSDDRYFYEGGSQADVAIADFLSGGRNADFFFGQFASLDAVDGVVNFYDGGTTADDTSAGNGQSSQDSDWLLVEIGDDEEYGEIALRMGGIPDEDGEQIPELPPAGPQEYLFEQTVSYFAGDGYVAIGDGKRLRGILDDVENVDASGNLYGFLDGYDVELGGRRLDNRDTSGEVNYGIGSSGQLRIYGSEESNKLIGGYDNDFISGGEGNDLLMGGNMQFFKETVAGGVTNPNLAGITNDGRDELVGGYGDDDILFEADGGIYEGDSAYNDASPYYEGDSAYNDASPYDDSDKLWLTDYLFGTSNAAEMTTDGVVRFDLMTGSGDWWDSDDDGYDDMFYGGLDNAAGYGGADEDAATGRFTADQTNYVDGVARTQVQDFAAIDATGLGAIDFLAAGSNDPELNFTNQQNFWGYNGDMTLRGHLGDNGLYAGAGDDVIEGRHGNDSMMGGQGNDDFYFSIDGDTIDGQDANDGYGNNEEFYLSGDGVDVIRRKVDANGDGLWDEDDEGNGLWGQDFGLDQDSTVGQSVLQIRVEKVGGNLPGDELDDVVNFVSEITTGVKDNGVFTPVTLNTAAIKAATTYQGLVDAINAALDDTAFGADLQASLDDDGVTIFIADAKGRELADSISEVAGAGVIVNQKANTQTENVFQFGAPEITVAQDRLIYKAYEDRRDNEGVDDDAVTGSTVTLGEDAYAEDLVVSFDADGTRLAEDQYYNLRFTNLTTEDVVKVEVNGVVYQLQVGVDVNGQQVDGEDGVYDSQESVQANFLARFADFINSFMDDDTAAGQVGASYWGDGQTIGLYQVSYDGEETVFMKTPVVTLSNASGGEPASVVVTNDAQHEVHLLDFDGRDNNLNSENVLFWGEEMVNRSTLETVVDAGGSLTGSEALIINGGTRDDLVGIAHNLATDDELFTDADDDGVDDASEEAAGNFVVHGDDYLLGGNGDDTIAGRTGDDRVRGSEGNDTLDGGGDWYFVRRLGETKGTATYLNAYEAEQLDKDSDVIEIYVIEQSEGADSIISGSNFVPYFRDTLIYHQADFTPGTSRFTITLNDYAGTGEDIVFDNGGAGTAGVDKNGDGTVEADNVSTFKNFENIRTVSGVGLAVAGANGGQGRDTLDVVSLSNDAEVGVRYDLTGGGGDVDLIEDTDDDLKTTGDQTLRQVIKVDGVENVIFGDGADVLLIDETEAAKDNDITGGLGADLVSYQNNFGDVDVEPTVTINVGAAHGSATDAGVDQVVMTNGRVGTVVATDTLRGVETVTLGANTAGGIRMDDTLNVEALAAGATVNYVNGKIYSDTDGDFDPTDGVLQLTVNNLYQMEYVVADGADTVVVADAAVMDNNNRFSNIDNQILIETYLTFDALDLRESEPVRLSLGDLRTIANGTANTADGADIPLVQNFELFNFELGQDTDTVDYSNELAKIAAIVNFDSEASDNTQYVMVSGDGDDSYSDSEARIDRLQDVERVVASQGESILDLTSSKQDLEIKFLNWDDSGKNRVASLDRDVYRIQLSDLATSNPLTRDYIEYRDTVLRDASIADKTVTQATASWNRIEGGDKAEVVILNSVHSFDNDTFDLRGGGNQVKYNELTRSINAVVSVTEFKEADLDADNTPVDTGLINASITFQDGAGNPLVGGGKHSITSYTAGNTVAEGGLRIAASQDAEDNVTFAGATDKLFILGVAGATDNLITVTVGEDDVNSIVLTGFEFLLDANSDDAYDMRVLANVQGNLTLVDNDDDHDAIIVRDDAINFNGSGVGVIDLDNLGATVGGFNFDFDVLDVTNVAASGLTLNGGTNLAPVETDAGETADNTDEVVVGALAKVVSINDFEAMVLTEASVAAGTAFTFNAATNTLQQGSTTVSTSADILSFGGLVFEGALNNSYVDDVTTGVTVNVTGGGAVQVHGGAGADTITGSGGNDVFQGKGGNDTLSGGLGVETRQVQVGGTMDGTNGNSVTLTFTGGGAYGVTVTEGVEIVAGAGSIAVGNALAAKVNANLTALNATAAWNGGALLTGATFDATTELLTFTFTPGIDVTGTITTAETDGSATFFISNETVTQQGGDGGADTFLFEATKAANGEDTINNFTASDVLNFQQYFNGAYDGPAGAYNFGAFVGTFNGDFVAYGFNKATLSAADFNGPGDFINISNGNKLVFITTGDADGVFGGADTTNEGHKVYYVYDSDTTAGVAVTVELVATVNTPTEFFLTNFVG